MDRWLELSNRRSRLRSGTRMLAALLGATEGVAEPVTAVDNADDGRPPKRPKEGDGRWKEEDDADPDYRMFLEHLRVDGRSYILEMKIGDAGPPLCLKYEGEDDSFFGKGDSGSSGVTWSHCDKSRGKIFSNKTRYYEAKKKLKKGSASLDSSCFGQREVEYSMVDENYQIFLNHVREYNGSMILELDNNIIVRYEEEQGEDEESEINEEVKEESAEEVQELHIKTEYFEEESCLSNSEMALQPFSGSPQLSNSSVDNACGDDRGSIETVSYTIPSFFGNRLKDVLQKPFDQSEYDHLMSLVTARTPKRKLKHLRTMSKSYETNEMGRSYLDHYPKFARELERADYHNGLLLLRGFFYWLENVVHDGAFKPWEPASLSYEALPTSGYDPMLPLQIELSEN